MFFVYMLASKPHGTLYVGSTSNLVRRVWEHKIKAIPGFTAQYGVDRLVWFDPPLHPIRILGATETQATLMS